MFSMIAASKLPLGVSLREIYICVNHPSMDYGFIHP